MKPRGSNYRLKYYNFWFLREKYIGCNLSLRQFSLGADFLGTICPRGNYVDDKSFERQFSAKEISRGILPGGNYLQGKYFRGQFSGGQLSEGKFSSGTIVRTPLKTCWTEVKLSSVCILNVKNRVS